mgnify:CR=1 FL=1
MAGLIVVFLISWFLLHRLSDESINVLGLTPTRKRLKEFAIGMLFMAFIAMINFVGQAYFKGISYQLNPDYDFLTFLGGTFWIIKAVVFEELVFRGALLYLLMTRIGIVKGCLVSSIAFGIYHWFSYDIFGERLVLMVYIFLVTGCGGWMFAYAFAKTKSLLAPIGLHLGWNFITAIVFSAGPIGNQLMIQQGESTHYSDWITLLFFVLQAIVAPGIVTWYLYRQYKENSQER